MFTRKVSVLIARPLDEVFAFVEDARNRPRWDDSVISEELTSPEPITVGTTVRTRLKSMGREYEYTWEVVEHEPPSRMTIESTSGPFPTTLAYRLAERDGATRVDFSVTGRPGGLLRLFQPLIARTTQANLDRGFPRLKQVLESGRLTPPAPRPTMMRAMTHARHAVVLAIAALLALPGVALGEPPDRAGDPVPPGSIQSLVRPRDRPDGRARTRGDAVPDP